MELFLLLLRSIFRAIVFSESPGWMRINLFTLCRFREFRLGVQIKPLSLLMQVSRCLSNDVLKQRSSINYLPGNSIKTPRLRDETPPSSSAKFK
jgi:hypothetical protein